MFIILLGVISFIIFLYYLTKPKNQIIRYKAKEATQGVISYGNYFYAIGTNTIGKYDKRTGKKLKTSKKFKHLNGGIIKNNELYITHNPQGNNWIEIFDLNLDHLRTINMNKHNGSLTWIDYHNNKWWGSLSFYKNNLNKSRIVQFDSNWNIIKKWEYPKELLNKFYPYSNSGGKFHNGLLFLTGHDKGEIYVIKINDKIDLINIIKLPITGQGISSDGNYVYGINRTLKEVVVVKL